MEWRLEDSRENGESPPAIDTHTLNPGAAKLAADEVAFLDSVHDNDDHLKQDELADWIGGILGEDLNPTTLFDDLNNGVRLLYLAKSIQLIKSSHLKDFEYKETVKNLQPDEFISTDDLTSKRASVIAKQRSNIAKFLEWCRCIGVPIITLFETADLTQRKNLRQVTTCLFFVSRIAARFGIEPPSSVKEHMEKEESKLSEKNLVESKTSDGQHLIPDKPPIYERDEEALSASPVLVKIPATAASKNYDLTSTPSSISNERNDDKEIVENLEPISPVGFKFMEEDMNPSESHHETTMENIHFGKKPFIEETEIKETPEFFIVDEVLKESSPVNTSNGHDIVKFQKYPNEKENTRVTTLSSYDSSSSSDENEYHTAQDAVDDEVTRITYHTAHADIASDEEFEYAPKLATTYESFENRRETPDSLLSIEQTTDFKHPKTTSPYSLYLVPADIVVERQEDSSDESMTDVESYVSNDEKPEVTFTDVGVGTDGFILTEDDFKTRESEIMINFPPYFEIATKEDLNVVPPQEYIVAPVRNEDLYAVPKKKNNTQRSAHANLAFETDSYSHSSIPSRNYAGLEPQAVRRQRQSHVAPTTSVTISSRNIVEPPQSEQGTQTHISLTKDVVRIISEMDDMSTSRRAQSDVSSSHDYSTGTTVVVRAQYQRNLPASDPDVIITEASDLKNTRSPRWGSVHSSTRYRSQDLEQASNRKAVRRSVMRRASSAMSEQFEKAVVAARKYKKEIAIVLVLLILTSAVLAAVLAVFLS